MVRPDSARFDTATRRMSSVRRSSVISSSERVPMRDSTASTCAAGPTVETRSPGSRCMSSRATSTTSPTFTRENTTWSPASLASSPRSGRSPCVTRTVRVTSGGAASSAGAARRSTQAAASSMVMTPPRYVTE